MTKGWITPTGDYYENDQAHSLDVEVPQRPSGFHNWNGSTWVLNQAAKDAADAAARAAIDSTEAQEAKLDAQIVTDLNRTRANIESTVDAAFPTATAAQKAIHVRTFVLAQASARKVLR